MARSLLLCIRRPGYARFKCVSHCMAALLEYVRPGTWLAPPKCASAYVARSGKMCILSYGSLGASVHLLGWLPFKGPVRYLHHVAVPQVVYDVRACGQSAIVVIVQHGVEVAQE